MKLEKLVGKACVRIAPGGSNGDRSFMSEPVVIDSVIDGVIYYRSYYSAGEISILSADYDDGSWREVIRKAVRPELRRFLSCICECNCKTGVES